ncbi:MAG TPA: hypothetical protein VGN57_08005 [Pirellulaceae bacterium]|jgi:hypothetical protein|nr:hypothetical protein [Pirellulaceae bacterium]
MIWFRDFVPQILQQPGFFEPGRYQSFEEALDLANQWIEATGVEVVNVETVVLPNIWSQYEEGSTDTALPTSGEMASEWHQFIRVWYRADSRVSGERRA